MGKTRLIKITNRTLDFVFSRFISISFIITLRQKPKGVTRSRRRTGYLFVELQDREKACTRPTTRNSFGLLPQGYFERNTY